MRLPVIRPIVAPLLFAALAAAQSERPFGLATRVKWTQSRVVGSPDPPSPYRLTRAFPQIKFEHPVFIAQDPKSERLVVAEYEGKIYSFLPGDPTGKKDLFLDMGRGISAFSFHPRYAENGQVFVFSHLDEKQKREGQLSRVSRFELEPGGGGDPPKLKRESEKIIVEWPAGGHNGGEAIIGPDGYLYISTGDGSGGSDINSTGQGVNDLLSVMMRLDVDHPDEGRAYSIPKDNPFNGVPGARGEIWAYGFRNPWRFSFDPVTGRPWVGDVGQDIWEMIELSSKGANHGWSVKEGSHPFHPHKELGAAPLVAPVVEHHHTECRSITGGYVYQGAKFPELRGAYIYGDYEYGKMWALRYDYRAKKVTWHRELLDSAVRISSFGVARDGSFLALDHDRGEIHMLERRPPESAPRPKFPAKLSETGLFESVRDHRVAAGVIPYSINAPFWSDGAHKERFIALPGEAGVKFKDKGAWEFDDGAVTVKSFTLDLEEGNPRSGKRIETRIVVKQDNHWVGYTYAWNDAGTDARLVEAGGLDRAFTVKDKSAPGGVRRQVWHYPSRNECMFCHSRAAGFVLGVNTLQMNREQDYGGVKDNQLRTLEHIGLIKDKLPKRPDELEAYPDPFLAKEDLEKRARAYLAVNCAMCHVADGGGNSQLEVDYSTPLNKARLLDEAPLHDSFGIANARLVAPGDPARSVLLERLTRRGTGQMPPSSSNRVDREGAKLVADWIRGLSVSPGH